MKHSKKLTHLLTITLLILASIFTLSACNNSESPKDCQHQWIEADCFYPKTCRFCQETEGAALGHNFIEATCTNPKTCSKCNKIEGVALGHSWTSATCQIPKTCLICATTEGSPLSEHNYQNGKCTFCNQADPKEIEYEFASNAYKLLIESHELCVDIMDSIYGAWYFAIYESDNYYMFNSCLRAFCSETNLNQQATITAIDKVLKSAGINDIDDDWRLSAMGVISTAVDIVIQVYIDNGDYAKIDSNLSKAKTSLNELTNTYSDYTGYTTLKSYYSEILSYAEFCKSPTGSFAQLKTTINTYETNLRNYKNNLSFIFE